MQNDKAQVLFTEIPAKQGKLGIITLNRPEALNALNIPMVSSISDKLLTWADDENIVAVVINSSSEKAFCAGGDLRQLYNSGLDYFEGKADFFQIEYRLCKMISEYPKPYIAIVNGLAMGGGVGLSIHATRIIASERLQFAMPETKIGFFPDVGASYFLGHCPDYLGMYLGLTGNTIGIEDAMFCGLIDAYVPSAKIDSIIELLVAEDLLATDAVTAIDRIIAKIEETPKISKLAAHLDIIKECFSMDSVPSIMQALEDQGSSWALEQLAILQTRSPSSLKITHRELSKGAHQDLATSLEMEFNLAIRVMQTHDLYEGIRAVLIDRSHDPKWQPATLAEVDDAIIAEMFQIKCKL